jgi:membrane-associated phospholipid phosphatase
MSSRFLLAVVGLLLSIAGLVLWWLHVPFETTLAARWHIDPSFRYIRAVLLVTGLGGAAVMISLALGFVGWLLIRGHRGQALWLFATIASGRVMVELLKHVVGRARPDASGHLVEVSSASFPSSHSFGSMLTVVALLWLFRPPQLVIALGLAWPIVVGVSRVMLGVHWPSDVLAGWGLALMWVSALGMWGPRPMN